MAQFFNMRAVQENEFLVFVETEQLRSLKVIPPKLAYDVNTRRLYVCNNKYGWLKVHADTLPHSKTHEVGGVDPIQGELDAVAKVTLSVSNQVVGSRRKINILTGSNIYIHAWEDEGEETINIIISAVLGGLSVASHNLLEQGMHPDTVTGLVARGDLITGQLVSGDPKWKRLPVGNNNTFLRSDGQDVVWSTVNWTHIQDKPLDFTPSPHNLLSNKHADAEPGSAMRGGLVVGKLFDSTPKWSVLPPPSNPKFLYFDGLDIVWKQIESSDIQNIDGGSY